jgi:conjugal transfer mating pair stabilization protein TraN
MKRILIFIFAFPFFVLSKEKDPMVNLVKSMEKAAISGLPELENAYGKFDAQKAHEYMRGNEHIEDPEMMNVVKKAGQNRLKEKDIYELTATLDEIESKTNSLIDETKIGIQKEKIGVSIHKCLESQSPEVVIVTRQLDIEVNYLPEIKKITEVCLGHRVNENFSSKDEAKKREKEILESLKADKTIAKYDVDIDGSLMDGYEIVVHYKHRKNTSSCKHSKTVEKITRPEVREIVKESWIDEGGNYQNLLKDPDTTFIQRQCMDSTPSKLINGLLVERPCWKEQAAFLRKRRIHQQIDCEALRNKNCSLIQSKCIEGEEINCSLWELTYECFNQFHFSSLDPFSNQECCVQSIEPNLSFSEVVAKLSVFQAIKEELANAKAYDPLKVEIFKGSPKKCNKSVASDVVYDCCFSYSGLAKQIGLAKCDADELALASLREEGLCHYIGMKEDKLLDLVTTNYEHVFCCFPTKLGRVINEQGRDQLKIEWGNAEHPNCQGLTIEQIQKLDFNKINLEEVFERDFKGLEKRYQEKAQSFQDPEKSKDHLESIKQKMREKLKDGFKEN